MKVKAFTLAELLIALAILGVIATFTIPKILSAQSGAVSKAKVKESAAMISAAYSAYRQHASDDPNVGIQDFTSYLNYVSIHTSGEEIDQPFDWGVGPHACDEGSGRSCLRLHNGSMLLYYLHTFEGASSTSAIHFLLDPDGVYGQTLESSPVILFLYYNGRITDKSGILANTCNNYDCDNPDPNGVPSWFSWD